MSNKNNNKKKTPLGSIECIDYKKYKSFITSLLARQIKVIMNIIYWWAHSNTYVLYLIFIYIYVTIKVYNSGIVHNARHIWAKLNLLLIWVHCSLVIVIQ